MSNLIENKFDVIILSLVVDEQTFNKTKACIDSYVSTAKDLINKVFVVETNENFDGDYGYSNVEVIKPKKKFNYNEFFNVALEKCKAEFIIGPNNDLIISPGCLQTLLNEFRHTNIDSISPVDRSWHRHTKMYLPAENKLYYGTEVSLHMFGCIFAARRSNFEKIGYLDEAFHFFYQDNDYVMCLQRCGLLHGVHTGARVTHQSGSTNKYAGEHCKYTPKNMNEQGDTLAKKWSSEPFVSGGYKKFKDYIF